ncbi:MAG: twin-arginine translocase TatA/TatE family subunit [Thermodesulfobacteriota bacterium]|jgi:sec-independent protein translocase protein TatB|nr:twin-arginine translocase TatA/TatE family subunit [Candidatus Dadabacteria bacterium]MCH8014558.1 twin-arginine translocase TatA/TatE family subunit [Candidatus Dadabacteria bacterium]MCZ6468999.1 twin-arginine translocase TatA/TatE family subunit [Candidatus Dadabacteria bacterium]MCZ6527382.1 twin-arginine translocase TatA/TatE family subunit [Candidatus Dadabacteria bacterium]MCZ6638985.1 twin-arginine translocase TatA/TatE family subunit [Candidatus Dadabacteria bacterium]
MFGIGTSEILIVLVIALLLLGPKEIPKIARTLGRGLRELERAKDELKQSIEFEDEKDEADSQKNTESKEKSNKDSNSSDDLNNLPSKHI